MASPIGKVGSLDVKIDEKGSTLTVKICEMAGIVSEGLSLSTWGAAFALANNLYKINLPANTSTSLNGTNSTTPPFMLELGAGTGLVGLSAALIWKANIILTDLPLILPGIAANLSLNSSLLSQHGASASCGALDWADPKCIYPSPVDPSSRAISPTAYGNKASVIFAADTIYSEEHPELLVQTILTWLAREPYSRMVMCYPLRMAYIDHVRDFWQRMEDSGLECVQEGREDGMEDWNEVANTPFEWCVWQWKNL